MLGLLDTSVTIQHPNQPSLSHAPASQPHNTESWGLQPGPVVPPAAGVRPQREITNAFYIPYTEKVSEIFTGISMIPAIVNSKQVVSNSLGRETTAALTLYIYDGYVWEVELCLGQADGESCLEAADQVQKIFGKFPGASVHIEQVRQMKIAIPTSQSSNDIRIALSAMFI